MLRGSSVGGALQGLQGRLTRWPTLCEVCRDWASERVCERCVQRFAAPRPRCARCALPLGVAAASCGDCLRDPPPFVGSVSAVDYQFPWQRLITQFKFHGQVELALPLARRLSHAVLETRARPEGGAHEVDLLLPVPLAPGRLRQRGYNQAWELARRVGTHLQLPAEPDLLWRTLDTPQQTQLGRAARQRNLRTAFMVNPQQRGAFQGRRVALVDDVVTTGATAREAAAVLCRAGAAAVVVWAVARTPAAHAER